MGWLPFQVGEWIYNKWVISIHIIQWKCMDINMWCIFYIHKFDISIQFILSGYVKIAMENGHRNSGFTQISKTCDFPWLCKHLPEGIYGDVKQAALKLPFPVTKCSAIVGLIWAHPSSSELTGACQEYRAGVTRKGEEFIKGAPVVTGTWLFKLRSLLYQPGDWVCNPWKHIPPADLNRWGNPWASQGKWSMDMFNVCVNLLDGSGWVG